MTALHAFECGIVAGAVGFVAVKWFLKFGWSKLKTWLQNELKTA